MSLDRFISAQNQSHAGFSTALAELSAGAKQSHWIWYIFPQLAGLGYSAMARDYSLRDVQEADQYLQHPQLAQRLIAVTRAVSEQLHGGTPLTTLMGSEIDVVKLVSSLTLFEAVAKRLADESQEARALLPLAADVLDRAARAGYPRCEYTLGHV